MSVRKKSRRGASTFGCLVSLLLFCGALYYGINIGHVYLRYYEILDGMRSQARLAPRLQDNVIYSRLNGQADSLFQHRPRPHFKVTRDNHAKRIVIESEYTDQVDLPFFKHTFVLRPRAEERL